MIITSNLQFFRDLKHCFLSKAQVPAEVENPSPSSLTERTTFARPHSVVFPVPVFQHPRNRA